MVHPSYTPCLRHAPQFLSLQLRPHTLHCLLRAHSQPSPDLLLLRTYSRVTHSLKASQLYSRLTTASPALSGCSELIHASLRADLQLRLSPSRLTHSLLTAYSQPSPFALSSTAHGLPAAHLRCTYSPLMATAHSVYSTYSQHFHTPLLSYSEVTHCLLTASPGYAAPRYCRLTQSSPSPWGTEGMEWDGGWGGWAAPRRDTHRLPHSGGTPRRSQSPGSTPSVDTPGLLLQQRR